MSSSGISRRSIIGGTLGAVVILIGSSTPSEAEVVGGYDISDSLLPLWLANRELVGLPTSAEFDVAGGREQHFQNADMYYSEKSGASIIKGKLKSVYSAGGGPAKLGLPLDLEKSSSSYRAFTQACVAGRLWWSAADGGKAVPEAKTVRLKGAKNFRDVAGEGSGIAVDGGHMRRHVVYRSSELGPTTKMDRYILQTLGVGTIVALSPAGTPSIPGIARVRYSISNPSSRTLAQKKNMYRRYVTNAANRTSVGKTLKLIATSDSPVAFQCLRGWDRSGWVAAVIQGLLGASSSTIMTEYLKSNNYLGSGVKSAYLNAALDEMDSRYGTFRAYVAACGVDNATVADLRTTLVV
jgi:hypothetical protein